MTEREEVLEILDKTGQVIGLAKRSELHGNPSLIHRVIHVLVFNQKGELLLQKRSSNKDVAPGMWDTSVGGHVNPGEDIFQAAGREMEEELGITACPLNYLYEYLYTNNYETELVYTFSCLYNGSIQFNKEEIDEVGFWSLEKIRANLGKNILSTNFEQEIENYRNFTDLADVPGR